MVNFITIQTDGLIGSNVFSLGIGTTNGVQGERMFKPYQAIIVGSLPNDFFF